jgi:double zinc ribbon protein
MSRFPEELKVIPGAAWVIAVGTGVGFASCLQLMAIPNDAKLSLWPLPAQLCFSALMGMILLMFALLVGYVNGDARRRGMRYVMWTWLSIVIPNGIGIILYFIMRDPLPRSCAKCGTTVKSNGAFCTACGTPFANICRTCNRAVEPGWSHCASCGADLRHG